MFKRFLFYSGCLLILFSFVFAVYRSYKPDENISENAIQYHISNKVNESSLRQSVIEHGIDSPLTVIFYGKNDTNSIFFIDNVLATIVDDEDIDSISEIAYFDLSSCTDEEISELMHTYQFSAYPCICKIYYQDKDIYVTVLMQDDGQSNISSATVVKQKLVEEGIIVLKNSIEQ